MVGASLCSFMPNRWRRGDLLLEHCHVLLKMADGVGAYVCYKVRSDVVVFWRGGGGGGRAIMPCSSYMSSLFHIHVHYPSGCSATPQGATLATVRRF